MTLATRTAEALALLRRIADDPQLAARMRADGLEKVKQFQWRTTAEGTLAIYREVIS